MSNNLTPPVPPPAAVYRIVLDIDGNWADTVQTWRVTAWDSDETLWSGVAYTRWGAVRQAKRAIRKLRKGKSPKQPPKYPDEIYVYP